tara:strand:- start:1113 stop:1424 length:312 start_codon:yes stop_codon:yes gene_type:complete
MAEVSNSLFTIYHFLSNWSAHTSFFQCNVLPIANQLSDLFGFSGPAVQVAGGYCSGLFALHEVAKTIFRLSHVFCFPLSQFFSFSLFFLLRIELRDKIYGVFG